MILQGILAIKGNPILSNHVLRSIISSSNELLSFVNQLNLTPNTPSEIQFLKLFSLMF